MRPVLLLTWCVLAIGSIGAVAAQQAPAPDLCTPKDLDKLQGKWKLVAQEARVAGDWYWGTPVWKKYEGRELRKDISWELWAKVAGHRVSFTVVRDGKTTTTDAELKPSASAARGAMPLLDASPVPRPAAWLQWVNEPQTEAEVEALRECLRRGRPYGHLAWMTATAERLGLESSLRPRGRPRKPKPQPQPAFASARIVH